MKKYVLLLLLLILPVTVFAKEAPKVTSLTLKNTKQIISYSGEIEEGSVAVMCKLYNSKDEELDLLSSAVEDKKFEGSFTVDKNDTYTVYCANYEGGEIKSESIKVKEANPKTGDISEVYCLVFAFSIAAFVIALMYPRFLKKTRKSTAPTVKKTTKKSTPKKSTAKKTTKKK